MILKIKDDELDKWGKEPFTDEELSKFNPPRETSKEYRARARIAFELSNLIDECLDDIRIKVKDILTMDYFERALFRRSFGEINIVVDQILFEYLKRSKQKVSFKKIIEPFLWNVMRRSKDLDGNISTMIPHVVACRLMDFRTYMDKARDGDVIAKEELKRRGWL